MRYALDTFLCRSPSLFHLSPFGEVQSSLDSGLSCFYYGQNMNSVHYFCWKLVHVINQALQRWDFRRGTFMLEGGKKKFPSVSCHYFWHAMFGGTLHAAAQVSSTKHLLLIQANLQNCRWFQRDREVLWALLLVESPLESSCSSWSSATTPSNRYKVLSSFTLWFRTPFPVSANGWTFAFQGVLAE